DLLVLADLARLWKTDLNDFIAVAALDPGVPDVSSRFGIAAYQTLGLDPKTKYFNAGVILLDLARWRAEEVARRALDYLRSYRQQVFFWDQEALNAVLAGRWGTLEPRWNWMPRFDRLTNRDEIRRDPWIVHFSGNMKPWKTFGASREHLLYYHSLDKTSWRGWRPAANWRGWASAAYESSRLRRLLYPLEQFHLRLVRRLTRR
ncbi:MAG: hypothetical protein M3R10_06410, partial [Verrucomicrobiota bacterium]|nr:hypothetical protein [Verrucomicrobiota bacterium]